MLFHYIMYRRPLLLNFILPYPSANLAGCTESIVLTHQCLEAGLPLYVIHIYIYMSRDCTTMQSID
jgi:hypothetical protein